MGELAAELGGFGPLTASGLVLVAVWLIFRGRLVPKLYYDEMRTSRDRLQVAADKKEATIADLVRQQAALIEALETTKRAVESLPPPKGG